MAGATFWVGQNGNIYYGSGQSGAPVQNLGSAAGANGGQYLIGNGGLYDRYADGGPKLTFSATQIADPSTSTGSNGYSAPTVDPQAAAYYQNQADRIQGQLNNLDPQFQVGKQNILNSYDDQNNQLNLDESRNTRDYQTNRANTVADNENAKRTIDSKVRTNTNSLQRLLGNAGSGNSSAAQFAAPYAAARAGSVERGQVQNTYGRNLQSADTAYNDYEQNLGISRADLSRQRDNQLGQLESGISQTRAQLLESLAGLITQKGQAAGQNYTTAYAAAQPYVQQADSLVGRIAELSRQAQNPALQAAPVAYQAPSLASYDYTSQGGPQANQPVYSDQISPYAFLFDAKRRQGQGAF